MKKTLLFAALFFTLLFSVAYLYLGLSFYAKKRYFDPGKVEASFVVIQDASYTLNYAQNCKLLKLLNKGKVKFFEHDPHAESPYIEKLEIALFSQKEPLTLTPLNSDYSLFSLSNWPKNHYLVIKHPKLLQRLLKTTYHQ